MADSSFGVNVSKVNEHFNRMFDTTMTRIRRCFMVKDAAIERIKNGNPKTRASGYYHLNKIIDFQLRVYGGYLERFGRVKLPPDAQKRLQELEALELGFIKNKLFNWHKKKLQNSIDSLEQKFASIQSKVSFIYQLVKTQRELLKVAPYKEGQSLNEDEQIRVKKLMTAKISAEDLHRLIRTMEKEELYSNELIAEIKDCRNIFADSMSSIKAIQKNFISFIEGGKEIVNKYFSKNLQNLFVKLAVFISIIYLIKVILVWLGDGIRINSTDQEFSNLIFRIQYGILRFDNIMDTLAAMPAAFKGIPYIIKFVKSGVKTCEKAFSQGSSILQYYTKQTLSDNEGRISEVPDIL